MFEKVKSALRAVAVKVAELFAKYKLYNYFSLICVALLHSVLTMDVTLLHLGLVLVLLIVLLIGILLHEAE